MTNTQEQPVWLKQLEKVINKVLALDEDTLTALAALEGQVLAFELTHTQLTLFLCPAKHGLTIHTHYEKKPQVLIKGSLSNFLIMLTATEKSNTNIPADMQIIGDIGLAQQFQQLMRSLDIDFEEPLSTVVGDTIAYRLGKLCRGSKTFAINTAANIGKDLSEYLRFEKEILPDQLLVEEFCHDVDCLREDFDRLTQRINQLDVKISRRETA